MSGFEQFKIIQNMTPTLSLRMKDTTQLSNGHTLSHGHMITTHGHKINF